MKAIPVSPIRRGGFSMVEILMAVSIIGILSAAAMPILGKLTTGAKRGVTESQVAELNRYMKVYQQSVDDSEIPPDNSAADENAILQLLSNKISLSGSLHLPGSPFISRSAWPTIESSDPKTYRLYWAGNYFKVLRPNDTGTGLRF
jgi:prepilin-type N-terminal cleavage/methylation domain-containing protein